ncbi:Inosine triphosphate pyrophosphatase [Taphrina deformans PYCC 5710]|uniref:Inosine triphosphate pyrophosphatase n=1 Tax=Taphrina deformans (strain PYCC 5710 / ATCC 11124 / CBS 356.35 / IMI 108563 / JCM 9778 / NBRC 8474) TaxID=1097556 RepID=R4XB17_TAPDE|nr:Inosine triphosphate pyrophosphatase [Taphrina deformans PYCC 5710]|eukprot:CCG83018.1 Inosine triphosphate pyrophosphatase [Taphrina deformans PYCC 5710]
MEGITFVTGNAKKLAEVNHILGPSITLQSRSIDLPEIQGTTEEIAIAKCAAATEIIGGPTVTEDTSLSFGALGPLPGPYIKWFLAQLGHEGLNRLLHGFDDKSATALCTFAYCEGPGKPVMVFDGTCPGTIVSPRGNTEFGWDAIFESTELGKTFGEATKEEKATVSHRYRSLDKLRTFLESKAQASN